MLQNLSLTIVVENSASLENDQLQAQHGLSILLDMSLESESMKLLWDTGATPEVMLHNADALNIDLEEIGLICLSHGHYDHTGGLMGILQERTAPVPLIAHPEIFSPKLKLRPYLKYIGAPFTRDQLEAAGAVMLPCRSPATLAPGVMTTGEVPRMEVFETVEGFWTVQNEQYTPDPISDDQSLAVHLPGKGLIVISGCAHSGIINTIRYAQRITGEESLYAVIGGFHLMGADNKRIDSTARALLDLGPAVVRPGHCTGQKALSRLQEVLGESCQPLAVGETIEL